MWFARLIYLCTFMIGWSSSLDVPVLSGDLAKIVFCYGRTTYTNQTYPLNEAKPILRNRHFQSRQKTVMYMHGLEENPQSATVQAIVKGLTELGNHNILVLDYSAYVNTTYAKATILTDGLGPRVAKVLIGLFDSGLDINKFHLVGHSLGAQLAGQAGRSIIEYSLGLYKLKRISGLDPAGIFYYPETIGSQHISRFDADFVDIIHTSAGEFGAPVPTGHVDFWPNGGHPFQPGCSSKFDWPIDLQDFCSHQRSVYLYAESIGDASSKFLATYIKDPKLRNVQMGFFVSEDAPYGSYYLTTNAESPYSKTRGPRCLLSYLFS